MDRLEKIARELDSKDELKKFKREFIYPDDKLYFDGNSLGMLSKKTKETIEKVINKEWGDNLISSWNDSWIDLPNKVSEKISTILNSYENEVYVGGSNSLNLYKLLLSIIKSNDSIKNISSDNLNFPSDKYICEGICKDHNLNFNLHIYGKMFHKYNVSSNNVIFEGYVEDLSNCSKKNSRKKGSKYKRNQVI